MRKAALLYGIIGLLAGSIIVGATSSLAVNNNNTSMMRMMGMNTNQSGQHTMMGGNSDMDMSMNDMMSH